MGTLSELYSNNMSLMLNALQAQGTLARHELADITGLTRTTVSRAIADLVDKGVVLEVDYGQASSRGGRKPIRLQLNDDAFCMIGLDLRREKVNGCLVRLGGQSESEISRPIPHNPSQTIVLDTLHEVVEELRNAASLPVMGIGLGAIGHVNPSTGIFKPYNFESMYGVPLQDVLTQRHRLPVSVRSGAGAAAIGEVFAREQKGIAVQSLAFVMIDYGGLGLGMMSEGVSWTGKDGMSEFGHTVIDYNGRLCDCGRRGCLTVYASGRAMLKRLAELAGQELPNVQLDQLVALAESGDSPAQQALTEAGFYLGYGINDIDCIMHPEYIVLGSSHPGLADWYMRGLLQNIHESGPNIFDDNLTERIMLTDKGSFAIAYGAAAMQIDHFFKAPVSIVEQLPPATHIIQFAR
ncbi:MAG: ROK family transcriptional regulator [Caldilineaceae bacterium]|nr:ROK family transcriptional regulator [Caldilineaceae bacterium]